MFLRAILHPTPRWNLQLTGYDVDARTVVAAGNTHGYSEVSYHWRSGSRFSFGATYYGADAPLDQRAAVLLNSNLEIQLGQHGKIQFDVENLNNQRLAVPTLPFSPYRNAFAPAPRTFRVVIRRSVGRTGTDNG
jgi:hypothetical protein